MTQLRLPKVKLPNYEDSMERVDVDGTATTTARKPKEIVLVRLHLEECANQVVLSPTKMYSCAKTKLEPLLEHASCLPSADFYPELSASKETDAITIANNGGNDGCDERKRWCKVG
ncbi:hypothetical protein JG687_00010457 [Phytophthora cactorum]|uniref:Uncharacterized protein n=1 Tax=Phytophthora cactorum TaxID=29920 RepID=A0A8T1U9I0_9STRA|nr:hypothetical protein GQ600_16831 [Phytophthora cactorum]KAG6956666.1 hypothetical protein JG687_00010457 [Phytophthora cactorum]